MDPAPSEIYTLSLHDALPIYAEAGAQHGNEADLRLHLGALRLFQRRAHHARPGIEVEPKRSEEHTSELQSQSNLVCRLLLEKKNINTPAIRRLPHRIPLDTDC